MKIAAVPNRRRLSIWIAIFALVCAGAPRLSRENFFSAGGELEEFASLPEFPEGDATWLGIEPQSLESMRGRVWMLKVWTFGCINCVESIPFTNGIIDKYGDEVGVLGIHSPEFDWERDLERLQAEMDKHDVRYPSYIDESLDYFFALEAPAWPAFFVVDKEARIRGSWIGEVHDDTMRGRAIHELIDKLLAE